MKKLDKKRHFVIGSEMFKQDILVCFNMTPKETLDVYKRKNSAATKEDAEYLLADREHNEISNIGTMYPMSLGYVVILKWYKDSFRANLCCAIHEFTHVSHYILRNVRIPLQVETEEAYTYLIEDLMKQFLFKLYK
jgi:hypothetical protein